MDTRRGLQVREILKNLCIANFGIRDQIYNDRE